MRLALSALAVSGMSCTLFAGPSAFEHGVDYRTRPLSVDLAVQIALKQNPSILSQIQQLKVEKGLVFQAQSKLLPQLTMAASYSQQDSGLVPSVSRRSVPNLDLLAVSAGQPLIVNSNGTTNTTSVPLRSLITSGATSGASTTTALQSWQVTLTVSQLIYDGGATIASRRAARINEDAAYYTLRDTIDSVVHTVQTQFYQILLDRAWYRCRRSR
jgi:outer membrane protein TolC